MLSAAAILASGAVFAADLGHAPPPAPLPPPVPAFTWTGFYIGANGGWGWGHQSWDLDPTSGGPFPGGIGSGNTDGGLFGGQIGYNWQVSNAIVLGLQADLDWADISGKATRLAEYDGGPSYIRCWADSDQVADCHTKINSIGSVTGRIGFLPWQNTLLYAKAGVAWTNIDYNVDNVVDSNIYSSGGGSCGPVGTAHTPYATRSSSRAGFTAGGGIEQRLTDNLSAFAEYDYADLGGRKAVAFAATGDSCTPAFTADVNLNQVNVVKFGLNWKFDFGAPPAPAVAARY